MLGLWLEAGRLSLRRDIPEPEPAADEALVRPILRGICSTDHQLQDGLYDFTGVPGHELVGIVESGPEHLVGRIVVAEINIPCGHCAHCLAGRAKHCATRLALGIRGRNGAFAERLAIPVANLHQVPDSIPPEQAVFVEPLAAALEIRERISVAATDQVLVVGDGKLGQLVAQSLAPTGCRLTVLGRHPRKLEPLERIGASILVDSEPAPATFDLAVECSGSPGGFAIARRAVRPQGTLALKSTYRGSVEVDLSAIAVDEIRILGSRCGPFDKALALLADGNLDLRDLIDSVYPLDHGLEAFACSRARGTLKVLIG